MSPASLWTCWPEIHKRILQANQLLLFLDYDGTLTPIVSHPDKARLPASTRRLLEALSEQPNIWIALVSGRSLRDLRQMVGIQGLCYVGNHGLELQGAKLSYVNPAAKRTRPLMTALTRRLKSALKDISGAWVENKGLTLSVHYRLVKPKQAIVVRNIFHEIIRPYRMKRKVRISSGKAVFEVRPPVRWTKGTIVNWLRVRRAVVGGSKRSVPVYIGDDATDEDAFKALGKQGITVAVSPRTPLTRARYKVKSTQDVQKFLKLVLQTCKAQERQHGNQ